MILSLDRFLNPIFKREVLAYLRAPWMRWAMGSYLLIPFIALAWQWPEGRMYYGGGNDSREIVVVFFLTQFALAIIIVPVMGAFAIANERENRTYEFLFTTLMRRWTIGTSKLLAILTAGFILTLCSMTVLSMVFFLGGVDSDTMICLGVLLASGTLLSGAIPLFFSTICRRGYIALVASYLTLFLLEFVLAMCLDPIDQQIHSKIGTSFCIFAVSLATSVIVTTIVIFLTRKPPGETARQRERIIEDSNRLWTRRNQWPYT